jgi:phosphatidylinositol-3-phosphatase
MRLALFATVLALLAAAPARAAVPPPVRHVFVVVLENKNYDESFDPAHAPYLAGELAARGQVLRNYYGIAHLSLPNYIALISGQGPNLATQSDCQVYADFAGLPLPGADGQAIGQGCVYPAAVQTLADQLDARGLTWKGYMEDMGTPCRHPALGALDDTQQARPGDQYAARHNPFVYFHSIVDSPRCAARDVPLTQLPGDLAHVSTTPNLSFITPNLCNDGHDDPCVDGSPGGLVAADAWLRAWIPRILSSPAFRRDGLLVVTFDEAEAEGGSPDASACCDEPLGPNTPNNGGPVPGQGGGRVGAVVVSPFVAPGTVNDTPYNHYALLRSLEDVFGVGHLGYAARDGLRAFGSDVYRR